MSSNPEHVLILRPGALGDTLLLAPALRALAGTGAVTVVGRRPGLSLLRSFGVRCIDFEGGGWHRLFEDPPQTGLPEIRPAPRRVAAFLRDEDGSVERGLRGMFPASDVGVFPGRPPEGAALHAAEHLAACLARIGMEIDPEACLKRARAHALLGANGPSFRKGIVLHPGSGGRHKNHAPAFWLELVRALQEAAGGLPRERITLLLGPAEEHEEGAFERAGMQGNVRIVQGLPAEALPSLLGPARLYVGHDSGVTHLAALLGTPTVALFRKTDPRVWGPLGPRVQVVSGEPPARRWVEAALQAAKALEGPRAG